MKDNMINYIWPVVLVVFSNTIYQVCAKSSPENMNAFASLTVSYSLAAVLCGVLYFITNRNSSLIKEYSKINWAVVAFGLCFVGLEVGTIFAYRAGWQISTYSTVQGCALSCVLVIVGYFAYSETFTINKAIGILLCIAGIYFINR